MSPPCFDPSDVRHRAIFRALVRESDMTERDRIEQLLDYVEMLEKRLEKKDV